MECLEPELAAEQSLENLAFIGQGMCEAAHRAKNIL